MRENRLTTTPISRGDYVEHLEQVGRGWVIEDAGKIVAVAVGNAGTGNIWGLFVHPDHEGRGYGRRLHDTMVEWLRSRGCRRLWLTTEPGTRAQRFYTTAGWTQVGSNAAGEARFEMQHDDG